MGRVLEFVHERLEQQDHQEMRQQIRLGGAFVGAGWSFEADQAFEAFEGEFYAPSETVKRENVGDSEFLRFERGDEDDPFRGVERAFGDLMPTFHSLPSCFSSRCLGRPRRLFCGDKA